MTEVPLTFAAAFTLGLLHSLEPSHAKAVLASYFLNRKRTALEAVAFAATVTLAHTLMIFALAIAGYALGPFFRGESVEKGGAWIGGLLMMILGIWMFWNERRAGFHRGEDAGCGHDHSHGHFFHHHSYHHDHPQPSSWKQIFVLGFCSGAIPCMSGLAVLVLAWRIASPLQGMSLVAVFSLGLGLVVLTMCLAMQQMARAMETYWKNSARWTRYLPVVSAAIIFLMGLLVIAQRLV